jgi:transposase
MAEAHPEELRVRVVEAYESGRGSYATVAELFRVGEASVKRWVWQFRRDGHVKPRAKGGGTVSDVNIGVLEKVVASLGDANAGEITAAYNRGRRGKARRHVSSIKRALYRAGYVVKKSGSVRWSNSAPTSWPSARRSGK